MSDYSNSVLEEVRNKFERIMEIASPMMKARAELKRLGEELYNIHDALESSDDPDLLKQVEDIGKEYEKKAQDEFGKDFVIYLG